PFLSLLVSHNATEAFTSLHLSPYTQSVTNTFPMVQVLPCRLLPYDVMLVAGQDGLSDDLPLPLAIPTGSVSVNARSRLPTHSPRCLHSRSLLRPICRL